MFICPSSLKFNAAFSGLHTTQKQLFKNQGVITGAATLILGGNKSKYWQNLIKTDVYVTRIQLLLVIVCFTIFLIFENI